jgi:hypothetical protein
VSAAAVNVLAHVEVPPPLPLPLLAVLAAAVVWLPGWVADRRGAGRPTRRPSLRSAPAPAAVGVVSAVVAVSGLAAAAGYAPDRGLAVFWLALTAASLAVGPVWATANPLRAAATPVHRWIEAGVTVERPVPPRLAATVAVAGVLALGWVQTAPILTATLVITALGYLLVLALGGVQVGQRWFTAADALQRYSALTASLLRPTDADRPGRSAFLAALVAVPVHARVGVDDAWLDLTRGLRGAGVLVASLAALVALTGLVHVVLRLTPAGPHDALAWPAAAFFTAHQIAVLAPPPDVVAAAMPGPDPELIAWITVPLAVLLAGHGYAIYRLHLDTRPSATDAINAVRTSVQLTVVALAVAGSVLMARPL